VAAKLAAHLQSHAPPMARVEARVLGFRAQPWSTAKDTPGNAVAARLFRRMAGGRAPLYVKEGGTIPALAYFRDILEVRLSARVPWPGPRHLAAGTRAMACWLEGGGACVPHE
jgi:hypothetical protein